MWGKPRVTVGGDSCEGLSQASTKGDRNRRAVGRKKDRNRAYPSERVPNTHYDATPALSGEGGREPGEVAKGSEDGIEVRVVHLTVGLLEKDHLYPIAFDELREVADFDRRGGGRCEAINVERDEGEGESLEVVGGRKNWHN